jgi:hypothetical protein
MLSTEKAVAKSLAPEITSGSALNSASIHSMNSGSPKSAGRGARRTLKSFKDLSFSPNKAFNLLTILETLFFEASLCSVKAFSRS